MSDKTTIQVRRDTKDRIEAMQQPSESLDETLRRELGITPQDSGAMFDKLVRFLSEGNRSELQDIWRVLTDEFNFSYSIDESPMPPADFALELRHPDTNVPVFVLLSSEDDSYRINYRGTDGMREAVSWGGTNHMGSGSLNGLDDSGKEEILRIARGAYATAGEG